MTEFQNRTNGDLLIFTSHLKYKQKKLYQFLPKLISVLQENNLDKLIDYIIVSFQPELAYEGLMGKNKSITLGESFIYAVDISNVHKLTIAIDRAENTFATQIVEIESNRKGIKTNIKSENIFDSDFTKSSYVFRGILPKSECLGQTDTAINSKWRLNRRYFTYIQLDSKKIMRASISKAKKQQSGMIYLFIIIFVILTGLLTIGYLNRDAILQTPHEFLDNINKG